MGLNLWRNLLSSLDFWLTGSACMVSPVYTGSVNYSCWVFLNSFNIWGIVLCNSDNKRLFKNTSNILYIYKFKIISWWLKTCNFSSQIHSCISYFFLISFVLSSQFNVFVIFAPTRYSQKDQMVIQFGQCLYLDSFSLKNGFPNHGKYAKQLYL